MKNTYTNSVLRIVSQASVLFGGFMAYKATGNSEVFSHQNRYVPNKNYHAGNNNPHQSNREKSRRVRQMRDGMLNF